MQQFLDQEKWKAYIDRHVERLDPCKANICPHPRPKCAEAFPSFLELEFHLKDVYCVESAKRVKRWRSESKPATMPAQKKTAQFTYAFVDETTKLCGQYGPRLSTPLLISSDCSSPLYTSATDEIVDAIETPVSSVCTKVVDWLDPCLHE